MQQTNIDSLHLVVPAYLQVTSTSLISASPPLFRTHLGPHATHGEELQLSGAQYYLLSLADGSRTTRELLGSVSEAFEPGETEALGEWVQELLARGLLAVRERSPEVLPNRSDRYARHTLFYASVGADAAEAQARLQRSSVALLGTGGIGTWVGYLLAAAGVGRLRLVDGDDIEESNLTRQVLFGPGDVGRKKVEVAAERLCAQRSDLVCEVHPHAIRSPSDLEAAVGDVDFVVLCANSPAELHDWLDVHALERRLPWMRAGYAHTQAICGPLLVPGRTGCTACVTGGQHDGYLAELPFVAEINARFQVASFGPLNGIAAAIAAKEVIAFITGIGGVPGTLSSLLLFDGLTLTSEKIGFERNPNCTRCSPLFLSEAS